MRPSRLVVFDVCNTLVDVDSTRFYLDFLEAKWYHRFSLLKLLDNTILHFFLAAIHKIFKYNIHRTLTFRCFKWIRQNTLDEINPLFFKEYLSKTKDLINHIAKYKASGDMVILLSASIHPPIELLARHLWITSYSSQLATKNGIYTGEVHKDLLGKKESIFKEASINIKDFSEIVLYTDNIEDISLIKYMQEHSLKSKFHIIINNKKIVTKRKHLLSDNKITKYEFIY